METETHTEHSAQACADYMGAMMKPCPCYDDPCLDCQMNRPHGGPEPRADGSCCLQPSCNGTGEVPLLDIRKPCPCPRSQDLRANVVTHYELGGCARCLVVHKDDCLNCNGFTYIVPLDLDRLLVALRNEGHGTSFHPTRDREFHVFVSPILTSVEGMASHDSASPTEAAYIAACKALSARGSDA